MRVKRTISKKQEITRQQVILFFSLTILIHCPALSQQICSGRSSLLIEDVQVDNRPYHLTFSDEFSGTSIDTGIWHPGIGVLRFVEATKYWLDPKNLIVENGILRIRAQRDTFLNKCFSIWIDTSIQTHCKDFYFSAGEIRTKTKFGPGIFEIRCKIPRGKGITFAFWTYDGSFSNEIDVFEFRNEHNWFGNLKEKNLSTILRTNIRTDYEQDKIVEDCSAKSPARDYYSEFHTFSVEWTQQKMIWRVDGDIVRISTLFYSIDGKMLDQGITAGTKVIVNTAFPRYPMEIYVNLALESGKNAPDSSTPLPAYFEVDYVRYYSR